MSKNTKITLATIFLAIVIIAGFALYSYTRFSNSKKSSTTISSSSSQNSSDQIKAMTGSEMKMGMRNKVTDDKSFLENMIPHHQEAIDSSKTILNVTSDPEIKIFAQKVITSQTKEIDDMKTWYKSWYNTDYSPNSNYIMMMGGMQGKSGAELDKAYVQGMIAHHKEAVQMAKKTLVINNIKTETKTLANDILANQNKEIKQLSSWLMIKYNDHTMMGM